MINLGILRDSENASSTRKIHKPATLEKNGLKAKALGDVGNTLYSRPGNFINRNTPAPGKFSNLSKSTTKKDVLSPKKATEKRVNATPANSDIDDHSLLHFHNHGFCEQEDSFINNYLSSYKLSEEEIENIVYGVKNSHGPVPVQALEPCEDIELPDFKGKEEEEDSFSVYDIFNDKTLPEIPPPDVKMSFAFLI